MILDLVVMFLVVVPAAVLQDTVTPVPWVSATSARLASSQWRVPSV